MAIVYPEESLANNVSSSSSESITEGREVYTVWMKSLVLNGHGCTVYDSSTGSVAYRVDNYNTKRSDEVFLMDQTGKTLATLLRKKLTVSGRRWEGYRHCQLGGSMEEKRVPWFKVQRVKGGIFDKLVRRSRSKSSSSSDELIISTVEDGSGMSRACYKVVQEQKDKLGYKVMMAMAGGRNRKVAEVRRKQAEGSSGVLLGEDVLTLAVEQGTDRSLVMALVVVCGLIKNTI